MAGIAKTGAHHWAETTLRSVSRKLEQRLEGEVHMITDETRWGVIFTLWIVAASIPYLYATILMAAGKRDKSNQIMDGLGLPWVVGFAGLIGTWSLGMYAWVGFAYSLLALLLRVVWVVWRKAQMQNKYSEAAGSLDEKLTLSGPTNMLLSNVQRYILIGVTAIIAIMLYAQIDDVGLDDSPWMIGLVVIAGLLLLAFAPRKT
jgi:hypothetical protein